MAEYKYVTSVTLSSDAAFDQLHHPAAPAPLSGIYCCQVCGHEAVSTRYHPLPPQNHHQHANFAPIQWRLIVASTHA